MSGAQATLLQYDAPYPVYALDWAEPQQHRVGTSFRLALGSFTEDMKNRISIIGLMDERSLWEEELDGVVPSANGASAGGRTPSMPPQDFVCLAEAHHGYPPTKIAWQPASAHKLNGAGAGGYGPDAPRELLASTADGLRIWEYTQNAESGSNQFGKTTPAPLSGRLQQRVILTGSKGQNNAQMAPLTSFAWNTIDPQRIVTASIDTTCTVWNINTQTAVTQLIAHDREVYDVAWLPGSTDIFTSVGADGSLRAFDLRSLEHSTILYETPVAKPTSSSRPANSGPGSAAASPVPPPRTTSSSLLRIAFNPNDANYMATFHLDSHDVQVLDMRSPGQPVADLRAHRGQVNAVSWGKVDAMLATGGDDGQLLIWDMASKNFSPRGASKTSSRSTDPKRKNIISEPILAYSGPSEISNIAWSPVLPPFQLSSGYLSGGEWVAAAMGKSVRCLKA
ncbi:SubName: Full=Related to human and petunia an11 protein {ECO:0000313/EMBL:CCA67184.1} [Serendipita indica DSM 11827]|uniref:Related to human and petunia an11 protein n=1 Tax=Serendipita indica (strain DSM 11827) TaxID=1109443 RepID=G4T743_SERID|nr:SubName: Full=Related to human and petunia an11 protein {ECO:0000313/EMBL:CCA67184.1} [Serendipita indica DSM 11827]CCA67184.1 related to human and petunia an11 protein [Serendipita indica DSM 11827]